MITVDDYIVMGVVFILGVVIYKRVKHLKALHLLESEGLINNDIWLTQYSIYKLRVKVLKGTLLIFVGCMILLYYLIAWCMDSQNSKLL